MKSFFASFILICYIFIGTYNSIGSSYQKPDAHVYVHSLTCQLKNYLALDCFDACNGAQLVHAYAQHAAQKEFIITTLSLDLHLSTSAQYILKTKPLRRSFISFESWPLSLGSSTTVYSPPDSFSFS